MIKKSVLVVALAVLLSLGGLPAQAHSQLTDANPRPNTTITSSPGKVVLTFNEELIDLGGRSNVISITNSKNQRVRTGETLIIDNRLEAPLGQRLGAGRYTVWWRAVSADGHPISGRYNFTIGKRR